MESTRKHDRVTATARTLLIVVLAGLGGCGTATAPSPSQAAAPPTTAPTATAESTARPPNTVCTPPAPAEVADGTATIIAPLGATACGFNANAISAPADAAFEVVLVVEDTVLPHNFSLYMDTEFQDLIAEGKFGIAADLGPGQVTTDVPALAAGIYYFRCDSHSRTMSGTVTTH